MTPRKQRDYHNMILTEAEIEVKAAQVGGTHVKRNNLRARLRAASNKAVAEMIDSRRATIRGMKASGSKECELRALYSEITNLEIRIL